jgi:hypothetical protein
VSNGNIGDIIQSEIIISKSKGAKMLRLSKEIAAGFSGSSK